MVGKFVRGGNNWAGELSVLSADAGEESGLALGSDGKTMVGDEFDERIGNVGKSLGSGSGVSTWHVGDAVVEDPFFDVNGVVVGGGA